MYLFSEYNQRIIEEQKEPDEEVERTLTTFINNQ